MRLAVAASVITPEVKSSFKSLGDAPWEVKVQGLTHTQGDDCCYVTCEYPNKEIKIHQLFLTDKIEKLLHFMIQTFRGLYDTGVMPVLPIPTMLDLSGSVIKFVKG